MNKAKVVKIGGKVVEDSKALDQFLAGFAQLKGEKILVHGGGKWVTQMCEQLDYPVQMMEGRRITDEKTLEVVKMMLAGKANKTVVAGLQKYGCNAIGLTGADGNSIISHRRPVKNGIDFGYVGDIDEVNTALISTLLDVGTCPVFTALIHDGHGQLLNTNADTIASEIACALAKVYELELVYCFELQGVLSDFNDKSSVIDTITENSYQHLKQDGVISEGMIPKIDNAFAAIRRGIKSVRICHSQEIDQLDSDEVGTGTVIQ